MKFLAALLTLFVLAAPAFAGETVKSPDVQKGLLEFEHKGRYQMDVVGARNHAKEFEFNAIYGVTNHWKTKVEVAVDDDKAGDLTYRRIRFENAYQLTKAKDGSFADTALYNDFTLSDRSDSSHDVTFGALAHKNTGVISHTANLYLRRDFGDTAAQGTNFIYRWQSRYTISPELQPGFEILGDTKKRDAFRDQSLGIGPAIYGSFGFDKLGLSFLGGDTSQKIGYDLAYIVGVTPATPDGTLRWRLKYGIQF